jgi:AmmeMemoRadiSam system protein B/AmmeMemoRadiSam system protein A
MQILPGGDQGGMEVRLQFKSQVPNPKSKINLKFQIKKSRFFAICLLVIVWALGFGHWNLPSLNAQDVKEPNVAGAFYPADPQELSSMIEGFLAKAKPEQMEGEIFALISPHAGYGYSGATAAFGYKLIEGKPYKMVIVIATSHRYAFSGVSVYPEGVFRTPLGEISVDSEFTAKLLNKISEVKFVPEAFSQEHSLEVQLPFLQKTLAYFKVVPIIMRDCSFETCQRLAILLKNAIGQRKDILVVASTDMHHGYDYREAEEMDQLTISYLKDMDAEGLYNGLTDGTLQLCGGDGVVATLVLSKMLGHDKIKILSHTTSAEVTGEKRMGVWTVGYVSCAIDGPAEAACAIKEKPQEGAEPMLNKAQRKKLLELARKTIETYLKDGKKIAVTESDPVLGKEMGAFVTLHKHGELRGCIGNIVGKGPLYLTVRDMAIEAATGDPRFPSVQPFELKDIEIEISVLSPLEKIDDPEKIKMGVHGVLVRKGFYSGVFLPQVATETGWSREEFMSNLCAHKAGLPQDAWKDKSTDIYIFSAEVFSENDSRNP